MTLREKYDMDNPNHGRPFPYYGCPEKYASRPDYCGTKGCCIKCWNREMPEEITHEDLVEAGNALAEGIRDGMTHPHPAAKEFAKKITHDFSRMFENTTTLHPNQPRILDSGNRRQFDSGAVRDIQEGKGRCDLLPLDVVAEHMEDSILLFIYQFTTNGNVGHLYRVLDECPSRLEMVVRPTVYLEVAKHFEEGCKKYGENNWQKGIPTHCYIDSAVRHYLKFLRGDTDEPHDRAFCWNILCCIWTCKHKPELNDYARKEKSDDNVQS